MFCAVAFSTWLGVTGALASLVPHASPAAVPHWHIDLASLWQLNAGPVTPGVPFTSPQDPCMQGMTRGSR